jgi:DNA-binding IclR family transcriptional regulator
LVRCCAPADSPSSRPRQPGSLEHGLALLACFSPEEPAFGMAELIERAELPREATQRAVQTLMELGYLEHLRSGRYRLGRMALWLGLSAVRIDSLTEVVRPWLCWMRARTGLTASLAVLDREDLDYLVWLPSRRADQAEQAAGRQARWSAAAHSRAAGLVLLAFTAESDWPARTRVFADRDPKRRARLHELLEDARERRYAISSGRGEAGVAAVVLGVSEPVAAVELTVFGERARGVGMRALAEVVVAAADGIAEQLEDDSRTVV